MEKSVSTYDVPQALSTLMSRSLKQAQNRGIENNANKTKISKKSNVQASVEVRLGTINWRKNSLKYQFIEL